jgi:DNA-binding response OmpR family regulator
MNFHLDYGQDNFYMITDDSDGPLSGAFSNNHLARYISLNDCHVIQRDAFVQEIFPDVRRRAFADSETFALSKATDVYQILLIGGNDVPRMCRFLRHNQAILRSVIKIAVSCNLAPGERARLLNDGFDDVLCCRRTRVTEARARITAIDTRMEIARQARLASRPEQPDVTQFCDPDSLTGREYEILAALAQNTGVAKSLDQICRSIKPDDPAKFKRSAKVVISKLRRKIASDCAILSDHNNGYVLYKDIAAAKSRRA